MLIAFGTARECYVNSAFAAAAREDVPVLAGAVLKLSEAVRARAAQPRDLAARIRALIQECAGRWADTTGDERFGHNEAMTGIRTALDMIKRGDGAEEALACLRYAGREAVPVIHGIMLQAADDLEAIVRECSAPAEPS